MIVNLRVNAQLVVLNILDAIADLSQKTTLANQLIQSASLLTIVSIIDSVEGQRKTDLKVKMREVKNDEVALSKLLREYKTEDEIQEIFIINLEKILREMIQKVLEKTDEKRKRKINEVFEREISILKA